jgi:hypothetical protein
MIQIHYAVQVCDTASYQNNTRFCGNDRTLLSKKSLQSLLNAIVYCQATGDKSTEHFVHIIYDNISDDLRSWLDKFANNDCIKITLESLSPRTGITHSIRQCYQWLTDHGRDFVFQIQDDYLFDKTAIYESLNVFYNVYYKTQSHAIMQPYNDVTYWYNDYRYRSTPRCLELGTKGYWIQIYDTSCSFLTSHWQFCQHWDLYEEFFKLIPLKEKNNLENKSLNYMFTKRSVLGLTPINTLSHHIQVTPDPYVDWRVLWDDIEIYD